MAANVAATSTKITETLSHSGSSGSPSAPCRSRVRESALIDTGKASTNPTSNASATGASGSRLNRASARRKPIPSPRKLASSTKLVSDARCTLLAAVHRISASSTNSTRKLSDSSRIRSAEVAPDDGISALAAAVLSGSVGIESTTMSVGSQHNASLRSQP
jgi:hypothetical protein